MPSAHDHERHQTPSQAQAPANTGAVVISVDAMGGDRGPEAVIGGIALAARQSPAVRFIVHGPQAELAQLIAAHGIGERCEIRDATGVVTMTDKPSQVMRHGQDTSMWSAITSVREGAATVAVSCGNTGALMAVSMIRLRRLPGVDRPAIACLWPSRSKAGFNVMLDVGADVKADPSDLLTYALMGAAYARSGLGIERPRVGLLNVGTEEHKGRAELKAAQDLIGAAQASGGFDYIGFVEGNDLPSDRVDVIVTDGFTGNIALKTGEGTAKLAADFMREAMTETVLSKIGALLAMRSLRRLRSRIDPRRVNGGVFLGLNGTVVKSHGSADATGVAAAIGLAVQLARSDFGAQIAARVASAPVSGQDASLDTKNGSPK